MRVDRQLRGNQPRRVISSLDQTFPHPLLALAMADVKKQEKDYTKEVDQLIPEAESIARVSVDGLWGLRVAF